MADPTVRPAHPGTRIGHCHLKVSDLERSIAWYGTVLGLSLTQRYGDQAAFMAFGDYHHHLGLNTWESRGGPRPAPGSTGLYHVAFLYPDRRALGQALARLVAHRVPLTGAADHGVSEALYLDDPDGNGIELYRDRDMADWPRQPDGTLAMMNSRLDLEALLAEGRAS